jgi:hypothetical protein
MSNLIPAAYIHDKHLVAENVGKGGIVAMGMEAHWPDLSSSDEPTRADFVNKLRVMLSNVPPGEKLQFFCTTSSREFAVPLESYHQKTASFRRIPDICLRTRTELVNRYRKQIADQELIQASARIYLSARMDGLTKADGRVVRGFDDMFEVFRRSFEHRRQMFDSLVQPFGGRIEALDNVGLYRDLLGFWSPGQARLPIPDQIDWLRPVEDLCRFSEVAPRQEPEHGFYLDGHYFGVVVAKALPSQTFATCLAPLLGLTIPGLRIVLNVEPLSVQEEIQTLKKKYRQLVSNIDAKDPDLAVEEGLTAPRERMRGLLDGKILPYRAQLLVVLHDRCRDTLDERLEAVRAALGKVGCEAFLPALPTSTIAFFNRATPGYGPWSRYQDYTHKVTDAVNAADLAPTGATPKGDLDEADAIFDGDAQNLVGLKMFQGSQPVGFAIVGPTGSAKSATLMSILAQIAPNYSLIAVIDNKLSYAQTCRALDPNCEPIVIKTGNGMTFNPLNFRGPLSPGAVSDATALVHLLVGRVKDEDKDKLRAAVIAEAIQRLYDNLYDRWRRQNPLAHLALCQEAEILLQVCPGSSALDAWTEACELSRTDPQAIHRLRDPVPADEDACLAISREPKTADFVRDLAFKAFHPHEFPTLSDLQDELHTMGVQGGAHKDLCLTLATLLRPWLRDGRYGAILDGPSNVELPSTDVDEKTPLRMLVFELAEIKESEKELKAVMGFLLANQIKNLIQGMPRNLRKMVIFEELGAFLQIPNGDRLIIDYYERARAYMTQVVTVFQQWGSLLETSPAVARAIRGNSLAMLLLKNNRDDLDAIGRTLGLRDDDDRPHPVKRRLESFPSPESLKGKDDCYAGFVWVTMHGKEPQFTAGRNRLSKELDRLVSSSGDVYEEKRKEMKNAIKSKVA